MEHNHTHERRFNGDAGRLRSPQRIARLEVANVVAMSLLGLPAASVLDIGTGTGVFAEAFAASGCSVTGIDSNADLLAAAQRFVPTGQFRHATAEELPFADESFDVVFLGVVLHEADDQLAALMEAPRVAKRRVAVLEWPYRDEQQGPPLAHRLSPDNLQNLVSKAGFRQMESIQLSHVNLYLLAP